MSIQAWLFSRRRLRFWCWLNKCFIVIADISKIALFAAWALKDADTLPVAEQGFVEVVDAARICGQKRLEKLMRGFR